MKTRFTGAVVLATLTATSVSFAAEDIKVTKVVAADVYEITRGVDTETVRLFGADAPELEQPFGDKAAEYVRAKILNKSVPMTEKTRDDGGLAVMEVVLPEIGSLGLHLVEVGYAWWDERNAGENVDLRKANAKAIVAEVGLWSDAAALSPWDYRHSHSLGDFSYALVPDEKPEPAMEEEKPREFSAKGETPVPAPTTAGIDLPKNAGVADYMGIATKMGVKFTDGGLTADNITGLPYAGALGFQDGDVISGVNGMPLRNEMDALNLYNQLKGQKNITVDVVRNGTPTTINIDTTQF